MAVETAVPLAEVAVVPMGGDDAPASTTSVASSLKSSAGGGATKSSESIGGEEEPQSPVPLDNNVDTSKAASSDAAVVQVQEETGEEEKTESTATPVSATSASPLARRGTTGNHRFSKLVCISGTFSLAKPEKTHNRSPSGSTSTASCSSDRTLGWACTSCHTTRGCV